MAEWKENKNPGLSLILEMNHKLRIHWVLDTLILEVFNIITIICEGTYNLARIEFMSYSLKLM